MVRIAELLTVLALALACTGCGGIAGSETADDGTTDLAASAPSTPESAPQAQEEEQQMSGLYIHVNGHALAVTPEDNSSCEALLALLEEGDITVSAHDYGNFEKVGNLPTSLPTNDERITTSPGDVILYQGNQLTVYYDENTWSFTRLGRIEGVSAEELRAILGDGSVELRLSLTE